MKTEVPDPCGRRLPLRPARKWNVEDSKMCDSPSIKCRLAQRHHSADVMTAHSIAFMPKGKHHFMRIARHGRLVIAALRAVGKTRAAQINSHHAEVLGQ